MSRQRIGRLLAALRAPTQPGADLSPPHTRRPFSWHWGRKDRPVLRFDPQHSPTRPPCCRSMKARRHTGAASASPSHRTVTANLLRLLAIAPEGPDFTPTQSSMSGKNLYSTTAYRCRRFRYHEKYPAQKTSCGTQFLRQLGMLDDQPKQAQHPPRRNKPPLLPIT